MRGRKRCRLHGGKSTGARTKEGIHRIRRANWKDGSRSSRLQREAKVEAREHEQELRTEFLKGIDANGLIARGLVGMSPIPKIKVRSEKRATEPPEEWRYSNPTPADMPPIPQMSAAASPDPDLANSIRDFLHELFPNYRVPMKAVRLIAFAIRSKSVYEYAVIHPLGLVKMGKQKGAIATNAVSRPTRSSVVP